MGSFLSLKQCCICNISGQLNINKKFKYALSICLPIFSFNIPAILLVKCTLFSYTWCLCLWKLWLTWTSLLWHSCSSDEWLLNSSDLIHHEKENLAWLVDKGNYEKCQEIINLKTCIWILSMLSSSNDSLAVGVPKFKAH